MRDLSRIQDENKMIQNEQTSRDILMLKEEMTRQIKDSQRATRDELLRHQEAVLMLSQRSNALIASSDSQVVMQSKESASERNSQ